MKNDNDTSELQIKQTNIKIRLMLESSNGSQLEGQMYSNVNTMSSTDTDFGQCISNKRHLFALACAAI